MGHPGSLDLGFCVPTVRAAAQTFVSSTVGLPGSGLWFSAWILELVQSSSFRGPSICDREFSAPAPDSQALTQLSIFKGGVRPLLSYSPPFCSGTSFCLIIICLHD